MLLINEARKSPPGSKGLVLLPYMSGERTPIWDPYARGTLFGLSLSHTRSDLFRAFLEGPAFAIRQTIEILENLQTKPISNVIIGGTAAANLTWVSIIADVIGKPVYAVKDINIEVLGAAVVGGTGVGIFPDLVFGMREVEQKRVLIKPNEMNTIHYSNLYQIYQKLYPAIGPIFKELVDANLPQGWVE